MTGICFFDAARFRDNCFCVGFIGGDFMPPGAGDKGVLRPRRLSASSEDAPVRSRAFAQPMHTLTPTFIANKGYATTHLDMDAVEAVGLVKMDILAQGGLAVMRDAKESLRKRGITVDLIGLEPWQDPEVWEMIASGGARAVHHIESPARATISPSRTNCLGLSRRTASMTAGNRALKSFWLRETSETFSPSRIASAR